MGTSCHFISDSLKKSSIKMHDELFCSNGMENVAEWNRIAIQGIIFGNYFPKIFEKFPKS